MTLYPILWERYASYHQAQRRQLLAGSSVCGRTLTYSVHRNLNGIGVGGYSDRLKGIAFAFVAAAASRRALFIDWRTPFPLSEILVPRIINWKPIPIADKRRTVDLIDVVSDGMLAEFRSGRFDETLFGNCPHITLHANYFFYERVSPVPEILFGDFLQPGIRLDSPPLLFESIFSTLFKYTPVPCTDALFADFLTAKAKADFCLGVHFRTGGGSSWLDLKVDEVANWSRVAFAGHKIIKNVGAEHPLVFVCSDDSHVKQLLSSQFKSFQVYTYDVPIVHIDRSAPEQAARHGKYVALEHRTLAECDMVICGRGEFARIACYTRGAQPMFYWHVLADG
jgi:hypothetical protein